MCCHPVWGKIAYPELILSKIGKQGHGVTFDSAVRRPDHLPTTCNEPSKDKSAFPGASLVSDGLGPAVLDGMQDSIDDFRGPRHS